MNEKQMTALDGEFVGGGRIMALLREQGTPIVDEVRDGTVVIDRDNVDVLLERLARDDEVARESREK